MAGAGLATTDYEKEYDNRARVPEHPEIFARWSARAPPIARPRATPNSASNTAPRRARPSTCSRPKTTTRRRRWLCSFTAAGGARSIRRCSARRRPGRMRAASASRSPVTISVRRSRSPPSSSRCAAPVCSCGASGASASSSTAIPPADIWPPACWRRTGRPSRPTRRPIWCRRPMRSPACSIWRRCARFAEFGSAARRRRSAAGVAAALEGARRAHARRGGRRARIGRVPAPEPGDRRELGRARRGDALPGNRRRQSFYRGRSAARSPTAR